MSYQGEKEISLYRPRAHCLRIEEEGRDFVDIQIFGINSWREDRHYGDIEVGHDGVQHHTPYVIERHNWAHTILDPERRKKQLKQTEMQLPSDIPLEHQG